MITSAQNTKIKWIKGLQSSSRERRADASFVVEGVRLAEEALAAGREARLVLFSDELNVRGRAVVDAFAESGAPVEQATAQVMRAAGDTETPQGILVVLAQHALPVPAGLDFVFIPDGMRDPGNLGTMLRTAAAAGAQAVFCPPETVDAFAPKVVRSGMGAHFRLPVLSADWDELAQRLARLHKVVAAAGHGHPFYAVDFRSPTALIVGSEAQGASPRALALADAFVEIPMPGGGESLNAAVAAGILMFEVVRQRRG